MQEYRRFEFRFGRLHRLAAAPFGIVPQRAWVEVDARPEADHLLVRFGAWSLRTPLANVADAVVTGPYSLPKVIGPPRLSFVDRGITFATNDRAGVCVSFRTPVRGIDPVGLLRHPGATVTVADVQGLIDTLMMARS
jgi:hypothetical protein